MGFSCGIVGLPNVGKSTLFNALLSTQAAESANYPFCTIEPNVGKVAVPDTRLDELAKIAGSAQTIYTQLEFVDIAGLVRGASTGEGLGNKFLAHIREVDAIVYVLRCFEDENITHVEGSVDPLRDWETIETELTLADLESLEKRKGNLEKKAKSGDKESKEILSVVEPILALVSEGKPARVYHPADANEVKLVAGLQLLTSKKVMVVCNVAEEDAAMGNSLTEKVKIRCAAEHIPTVIVSAKIESEVASLESPEEKAEFLGALGLTETGLTQVIRTGQQLLNLITFFTIGPKEARAWTVHRNATAPEAAGVIHTDFERGFIRAETIAYADYVACKGEQGAKDNGKLRSEGKTYIVQDGDVFHFLFNV